MHAPIEHHAAAAGALLAPRPGDPVAAHHARFDAVDVADAPVRDDIFHGEKVVVPAAVLMHRKHHAGALRRGVHFLRLRHRKPDRLFADDVFARRSRLFHILRVNIVGRCDERRADRRIRPDLLRALKTMQARFLGSAHTRGVDIVHARKTDACGFFRLSDTLRMIRPHSAVADQRDVQHISSLRLTFVLCNVIISLNIADFHAKFYIFLSNIAIMKKFPNYEGQHDRADTVKFFQGAQFRHAPALPPLY